jgi:hypothetical protein
LPEEKGRGEKTLGLSSNSRGGLLDLHPTVPLPGMQRRSRPARHAPPFSSTTSALCARGLPPAVLPAGRSPFRLSIKSRLAASSAASAARRQRRPRPAGSSSWAPDVRCFHLSRRRRGTRPGRREPLDRFGSEARPAARVSRRGRRRRRKRERKGQGSGRSLFVLPWPRRGPSCPVPGVAWRAATAVLSTVTGKKMRCEKTILPLAGMQNHGGSHRTLLFGAVTTDIHVHSVADIWVPWKAGPLISDWAGISPMAMEC